ncbi:MAG: CBS domain-containing protein, partial [Chitinivibrionales bacterium]|nr:CBS domain-containing protein [Chitinivibrionales bacterium]
IKLFSLSGFDVRIDISWLLIAFLITWSLATGLFPHYYADLTRGTYWLMGIAGAIGLFASIILHEFCHSFAARKFGMPMKGITLFIFGGVAEMDEEPPSAKAEFVMAIAGPLASIVFGGTILLLLYLQGAETIPVFPRGVLQYLGSINLIVAGFNLLPAFPLDGGRVLRAALWTWKKDIRTATRIASYTGNVFGIILIVLGIFSLFSGALISGMWWIVLGLFVRQAAHMSYHRLVMRRALEGEPVGRFMNDHPVTVDKNTPVDRFVYDYVYRHHHKMFPVVDHGEGVQCVATADIKRIDQKDWHNHAVGEIARSCSEKNTLTPDIDAVEALARMHKTGNSRMIVTGGNGTLKGIITIKDLMGFLSAKLDLEGDGSGNDIQQTVEQMKDT